jgi:hypothetical protein
MSSRSLCQAGRSVYLFVCDMMSSGLLTRLTSLDDTAETHGRQQFAMLDEVLGEVATAHPGLGPQVKA